MRNPNGPDRRIRELERLAAAGDPEAADRLGQLLWQTGRSDYQTEVALATIRRGPIGEWTPTWSFPGALIWHSPRLDRMAIATPWYAGATGFSVQVEPLPGWITGSSRLVPLAQTGDVVADALEYRRLISPLLEDLSGPAVERRESDAGWDFNPDPSLRKLERAAAAGDPEAALQLVHARHRAGLIHPAALFLLARMGVEPERAAATEIFDRAFMRPALWPVRNKRDEYEWTNETERDAIEDPDVLGRMFHQFLFEDIAAEWADALHVPIERLVFRRRAINQAGILAEDYLKAAKARPTPILQPYFDMFDAEVARAARPGPEPSEQYRDKVDSLQVALGYMIRILDLSWVFAEEEELPDRWVSECRGYLEEFSLSAPDTDEREEELLDCLATTAQDRVDWNSWPAEQVRVLHQHGEWIAQSNMPIQLQQHAAFDWIVPKLVAWLRVQEA